MSRLRATRVVAYEPLLTPAAPLEERPLRDALAGMDGSHDVRAVMLSSSVDRSTVPAWRPV